MASVKKKKLLTRDPLPTSHIPHKVQELKTDFRTCAPTFADLHNKIRTSGLHKGLVQKSEENWTIS